MAVRQFNGSGDAITCDRGTLLAFNKGVKEGTMFALVKLLVYPDNVDNGILGIERTDTSLLGAMYTHPGTPNDFAWGSDDPSADSGSGVTISQDAWWLLAITKPTGTSAPRFHQKLLSAGIGSWNHLNGSAVGQTVNDVARIRLGGVINSGANMRLACVAIWDTDLSDAEIESIGTAKSTASIYDLAPNCLWDLNQESISPLSDLTGGGANQISITGTSVVTGDDPPGWTFGLTTPIVISTTRVDALAGSGSTSVTVPTNAEAVVAFFSHFDAVAGAALATMTLGGVAMTDETDVLKNEQMAVGDAGTNSTGVGVEYLSWLPGTGTQTLAWSWSAGGNQDEGGAIYLVWLRNVNIGTPFRDFALDSETASTAPSVSIACKSTDLVIGYVQNFSAFGNFTGATVDTLLYTNDLYNSENVNVATLVASNGTLTFSNTSPNYSTLAAISIAAKRTSTFPEVATSISDDFNRADADALGSNWTEIADVDIVSNQMFFPGPGHGMAYWTPAKFLDQEIRVQVSAIGTSNMDIQWRAALASNRANDPTTTTNWSGPHLFISASTNTVQLRAWDGTGQEGLHDGMKVPGGIQAFDEFGIRAVSRSFEVYHRRLGEVSWRLLGARAYEQFYSQGRVMLEGFSSSQTFDDFGVAAYTTPTTVGQYIGTGIHAVSGGAGNGVATFDLTVPETISVGDTTFFCVLLEYGQRGTLTWPDGSYTQVGTWVPGPTTDPYGTPAIGVFRKVYAGVTPVHVTAVTGTTRGWNISQVAYKGDVSAIQTATGTHGDSTLPRTGPSLSGTVPGNRLVCFHGGSAVDCRMQWSAPFACRQDGEYFGMNSVADAPAEDYLFPIGKVIDYGAPSTQSMWLLAEVGTVAATPDVTHVLQPPQFF